MIRNSLSRLNRASPMEAPHIEANMTWEGVAYTVRENKIPGPIPAKYTTFSTEAKARAAVVA